MAVLQLQRQAVVAVASLRSTGLQGRLRVAPQAERGRWVGERLRLEWQVAGWAAAAGWALMEPRSWWLMSRQLWMQVGDLGQP